MAFKKVAYFIAFFQLVMSTCAFAQEKHEQTVMTDTYYPFSYLQEGVAKGVNIQVIELVMRRMKQNYRLEFLPWKRGMRNLKKGSGEILFPVIYTEERAKYLKFACSLDADKTYLYTLRDSSISFSTLDAAKKYSTAAQIGLHLANVLSSNGFNNLSPVSTSEQVLAMLMKKRIDFIALGEDVIEVSKNSKLKTELLSNSGVVLFETKYCVAFSQSVPDKVVSRWEQELKMIHADNTYNDT